MKIVSWNCNGKFREKFQYIQYLDADIYIIQECENPQKYPNTNYSFFAQNHIWIGENENRGLGIFAKKDVKVTNNEWSSFCLRHFLSVRINDEFDILGVWACKPYIEEFYVYQSINFDKFSPNMLIIGDFNSNAIWDKKQDIRTHMAVVDKLSTLGLVSVYHTINNEFHGTETQKTFFLYRHQDKGYYIDYAFSPISEIVNFQIADRDEWLKLSDHIPIVVIRK